MSAEVEPTAQRCLVTVVHSQLLVAEVVALWLGRSRHLTCLPPPDDVDRLSRGGTAFDAVILDQRTFDVSGPLLLEQDRPPVLVVLGDDTSRDPTEDCLRSLRGGARGWVSPDAAPDLLVDAVLSALAGLLWLPHSLSGVIVARLLDSERNRPRIDTLTARELEVLRHLIAGHSTAVTAERMYVSTNTVRSHRTRMFGKLGVHAALEAVAVGRAAGLTA